MLQVANATSPSNSTEPLRNPFTCCGPPCPCGHACVLLASLYAKVPAMVDPIDTATDDHPVAYREPYTPLLRADLQRPESAGARRQRTPHRYQRPHPHRQNTTHPGTGRRAAPRTRGVRVVEGRPRRAGAHQTLPGRHRRHRPATPKTLLWPAGVRAMVTDPTRSITTPGTGYERPPSVVAEILIGATSAAGRAAARECVRRSCCARSPMCHRRW
jgi:hypothetical protein